MILLGESKRVFKTFEFVKWDLKINVSSSEGIIDVKNFLRFSCNVINLGTYVIHDKQNDSSTLYTLSKTIAQTQGEDMRINMGTNWSHYQDWKLRFWKEQLSYTRAGGAVTPSCTNHKIVPTKATAKNIARAHYDN